VKIRYLDREEVDTERWDKLIANSRAESLYPYSWYLDAACDRWSALVMDHYRFVMPFAWRKKFGIRYLYQPVYCQQLGVHGSETAEPFITGQFLDRLTSHFRAGVYHFNAGNMVGERERMLVEDKSNHVLALQKPYNELSEAFSDNARRNLKKASAIRTVEKRVSLEDLLKCKMDNDPVPKPSGHYRKLELQLGAILNKGQGQVYGIRGDKGLDAAAFIAFSRTRLLYLLSVSSESGKERRAMFRIVDQLIRDHAGSGKILDFEGSSIPSIARFFSGFGASPETYQEVRYNRLPLKFVTGKRYGR